jgi:hypothetical protein
LEIVGVNGWVVLKDLKETGWEGLDWTWLSYDTEKWWAILNAIINLRIP